jgi:hypothetical protein
MPDGTPQVTPARNEGERVTQALMPSAGFNMVRNLEELAKIFLGWASVTLEVFIRRDFGERYLTVGRILTGYLFIRFWLGVVSLRNAFGVWAGTGPPASPPSINSWYVTCLVLLALVHLARIFFRNQAGVPWYSRGHGVSWFNFLIPLSGYRLSDWVLYRFIEPGICFAFAWFVMPLFMPDGSFTRNWLIFASIGLFLHNNMAYNATRDRYLDLIDGEIVSRYFNESRQARKDQRASVYQTAGYAVMPVPHIAKEMLPPDIVTTVQETMGSETG